MPQAERYDALILGSGQGGKLLAWELARSGRKTACVERKWVGGSCPNIACMPSKNEVWSAKVAHLVAHAAQFGAKTSDVAIDMARIRQRKRDMVAREVAHHLDMFKRTGAELIMGNGRLVAPKTVEIRLDDGATRVIAAEQVFLNLGSHAAIPNLPGLAAARPLTHVELLELDYAPAHLIVLGGGYVGLEMAQAYLRLGCRVTVIESGPQVLAREDTDVSEVMHQILGDEGIRFVFSAQTQKVEGRSGEEVRVTLRTAASEETLVGSDILVAAGRSPNTAGLGLEEAGIALDARGYVRVNERLETAAPGVWALGECAGSPQFTHISIDDFRIIRTNLAGGARGRRDRLVPYCVFTDPPLARVGLSEREAQQQGIAVRIAKLQMSSVLRTATTGETQGFMKALVSDSDDRILGFAMIGSEAGEVMAAVEIAMLGNLPYQRLRDAVITHLTMAEGLGALFANVPAWSAN
jgi:pyruvate/2-oxoglutarate dehydrogenase complex dihydrolipoamide dehydrogenase (E3) component